MANDGLTGLCLQEVRIYIIVILLAWLMMPRRDFIIEGVYLHNQGVSDMVNKALVFL